MKIARIVSWLPEKTAELAIRFADFGREEDLFHMGKIKLECKCQVAGCWEDVRWLYLRYGTVRELGAQKNNAFFSRADLKNIFKYMLHPFQESDHQEREQLCQMTIFRTCEKHREENCAYTRMCLQKLGWRDKEEFCVNDDVLFPNWLIFILSIYAIILVEAFLLASSSYWQPQNIFQLSP